MLPQNDPRSVKLPSTSTVRKVSSIIAKLTPLNVKVTFEYEIIENALKSVGCLYSRNNRMHKDRFETFIRKPPLFCLQKISKIQGSCFQRLQRLNFKIPTEDSIKVSLGFIPLSFQNFRLWTFPCFYPLVLQNLDLTSGLVNRNGPRVFEKSSKHTLFSD